MISWHVDVGPIGGGTPGLNTCGAQAGAGSYPFRPGVTGSTVLTSVLGVSDTITITGMYHLVGKTVSLVLGGLDCGDLVVAGDGSITIAYRADPGGLLTPAFLVAADGSTSDASTPIDIVYADASTGTLFVDVVVGYTYTSQGRVLRPATEADTKSPQGGGLAKTRRVHSLGALLTNSQGLSFGTDFTTMRPANFVSGATLLDGTEMFNGVHWMHADDGYDFDGMVSWQVTRPVPAMINAIATFVDVQER